MSYKFKEIWCNKGNFTAGNRTSSDIDTIVIHYTGNNGDTAENNGNYFKNNIVETSAHYFVDNSTVVRSVADRNIAWHAGNWNINSRSIGIEIAGSTKQCSGKTLENVILLTQRLMKKYNISKNRVIRHYDANGKLCPAFWCGSTEKDKLWKEQFWNKLDSKVKETAVPEKVPSTNSSKVKAGMKLSLKNVPLYASSTAKTKANTLTGIYYLWSTEKVGNRYRITNSSANVGKGSQVTGWIDSKYVTTAKTAATSSKKAIKVGGKVKVNKAVTYDGKAFTTYRDKYDVIEVSGDRVVIGIGKTVTAAVKASNLTAV